MFRGIDFENGIDKFRERARKMSDDELIRQGKECRSLCSPKSNYGKPPLDIWVQQLSVLREEWCQRHPKK